MRVYEIKRLEQDFELREGRQIKSLCCVGSEDSAPIVKFYTLEEAREELKKYKPTAEYVQEYGSKAHINVVEYVIEIYEADEDGDFLSGSDFDSIYNYHYDEDAKHLVID